MDTDREGKRKTSVPRTRVRRATARNLAGCSGIVLVLFVTVSFALSTIKWGIYGLGACVALALFGLAFVENR